MALKITSQFVNVANASLYISPPQGNVINPLPTGEDAPSFAANAKAQSEAYDNSVYLDDDLRAERDAAKGLCPRPAARWVAVASGNWSDASTWYDTQEGVQAVPNVAETTVFVPQGVTVSYDVSNGSEVDFAWVRVDGVVDFDKTADRTWTADFTFVDHTGHFICGTDADPVPHDVTMLFRPYRTDDMDFATDRMKLGRGVLCFDGNTDIVGHSKVAFARATGGLLAGATSVTVDQQVIAPAGYRSDWKIGDELEITGTRMRGFPQGASSQIPWDAEIVTITGIDNSTPGTPTITFAPALVHDHLPCFADPALTCHVINRTRNIKFQAANGEATEAWRRPHNLFKGNGGIDIQYVEVRSYGRTDHRDLVLKDGTTYGPIDYQTTPSGAYAAWNGPTFMATHGMNATTARTIFQGRYSLHAHRCGFENPNSPAITFTGCVVVDNTSWGYVHHDSHAIFTECVASDCMSGGIISEGGGSLGSWIRCISGNTKESHRAFSTVQAKVGGGAFGDIGHAYWANSRTVKIVDCIAHDANGGFTFTSRASSAQSTNVYPGATDEPKAFYGQAQIPGSTVQKAFSVIQGFDGCESYACVVGGSVAKKQANQHHNVRTVLKNFRAWEVQVGFHVQYTGHYTIKDFNVTGFDQSQQVGFGGNPLRAMDVAANAMDVGVVNLTARNFNIGIRFGIIAGYSLELNRAHFIVEPTFTDIGTEYEMSATGEEVTSFPHSISIPGSLDWSFFNTSDVGPDLPVTYNWQSTVDEHYWDGTNYIIFGSYTDRLGTQSRILGRPTPSKAGGKTVIDEQSDITGNTGKATTNLGFNIMIYGPQMEQMIRDNGYYTQANGEIVVLFPDLIGDRFSGDITYFDHPVAIRCSQSQWDAIGNKTNNGPLPDGPGEAWEGFNPAGTPGLT